MESPKLAIDVNEREHLSVSMWRPVLGVLFLWVSRYKLMDGCTFEMAVLYLMVTGVNSIIVVTLSRKAERMAAMRQRMMIIGHTLPLDNW